MISLSLIKIQDYGNETDIALRGEIGGNNILHSICRACVVVHHPHRLHTHNFSGIGTMKRTAISRDGVIRRGDIVSYYKGKELVWVGIFEGYEQRDGRYLISLKDAKRPYNWTKKHPFITIVFTTCQEVPTLPLRRARDMEVQFYESFK